MVPPPSTSRGPLLILNADTPWGASAARALSAVGRPIALASRPGPEGEATVELVRRAGADPTPLSWNPLRPLDFLPGLTEWIREVGPVSALVGMPPRIVPDDLFSISPEGLAAFTHGTISLPALAAWAVLPGQIQAGRGRVMLASLGLDRDPPPRAVLGATAAGTLRGFAIALDREVRRSGIEVTFLEVLPEAPGDGSLRPSDDRLGEEIRRALETVGGHGTVRKVRVPGSASKDSPDHAPGGSIPGSWGAMGKDAPRGRVLVITGASRGIGRAEAIHLARPGDLLVLTARDEEALQETAGEVRHRGAEAIPLAMDLRAVGATRELARIVRERAGPPQILSLNAGVTYAFRLPRLTPQEILEQVEVDLLSVLGLGRELLPPMMGRPEGRLLITGSAIAEVPLPRMVPYAGVKSGLRALGRALDHAMGPGGPRVTVLEPIVARTDLLTRATRGGPWDTRRILNGWTISADTVGRYAQRAVLHPRPVMVVPSAAGLLLGMARALGPLLEPRLRIPPPRASPRAAPSGSPL